MCCNLLSFKHYGSTRILQIDPMWVTTGELAASMKPDGKLSNTVAEIGISVLQRCCADSKIIFPWIVTSYLLDRKFHTNVLKNYFRRDGLYKLSHKRLVQYHLHHIFAYIFILYFFILSLADKCFFMFYSLHSFLSRFFRSLGQMGIGTYFR